MPAMLLAQLDLSGKGIVIRMANFVCGEGKLRRAAKSQSRPEFLLLLPHRFRYTAH
jgi:hypothetical protein